MEIGLRFWLCSTPNSAKLHGELMNLRHALSLLLLTPLASFAQVTCPTLTTQPLSARDETRLRWSPSTWTNPPPGAAITYSVYRGSAVVCVTTAAQVSVLTQPVGTQSYYVTAKSPQSEPPNVETAMSNVVTRVIAPPPVLNPPTALTVIADPTAYEIRTNAAGTLVAARIGRVELGTMCSPTESQTVAGVKYNRVALKDTDLIVWPSASPNTARAWAKCG